MPTARLSALVPAVGPSLLADKLADLAKLGPWLAEVVVCFNGPQAALADTEAVVDAAPVPTVLSVSPPFAKTAALRAGLSRTSSSRILYSDVDCLIHGEPGDLDEVLASEDVCSFLVLRAPPRGHLEVEAKLFRRQLLGWLYDRLGLVYLSARGGGYVAGDLRPVMDDRVLSDDLLLPAELAARAGRRIVPSRAIVFYEAVDDPRRYEDKLPRLLYGTFQAYRLASTRRIRASLLVQKVLKYVAVAAVPPAAVLGLRVARRPLWPAALLLVRWRLFLRTWEGLARGVTDRKPRW